VLRLHRNYACNYGTRNYAFCYTQTLRRGKGSAAAGLIDLRPEVRLQVPRNS
jgi:hypothetical protein